MFLKTVGTNLVAILELRICKCKDNSLLAASLDDFTFSKEDNSNSMIFALQKNTLWPLFMDGIQLSQGYRATMRRQFTFYHSVPRSSWYSID